MLETTTDYYVDGAGRYSYDGVIWRSSLRRAARATLRAEADDDDRGEFDAINLPGGSAIVRRGRVITEEPWHYTDEYETGGLADMVREFRRDILHS